MGRRIREDFDGVVQAYEFGKDGQRIGGAYTLPAGAHVPDEVDIAEHLLEPDGESGSTAESSIGFDPSTKNVNEVNAYLDGVSDAERRRVLALEAGARGHKRKGLLEHGPYSEFAPAPKKTAQTEGGE